MTDFIATKALASPKNVAAIPLAALRDFEQDAVENPWRVFDELRERALKVRSWPDYAFADFRLCVDTVVRAWKLDTKDLLIKSAEVGVLAPWRITRGIYYFDADLSAALAETDPASEIPIDILVRLPEWSVCIVGESLSPDASVICAFAGLVYDSRDDRTRLRIVVVHPDGARSSSCFALASGVTVSASLTSQIDEHRRNEVGRLFDEEVSILEAEMSRVADILSRVLAHLLYLCADSPDMAAAPEPPRAQMVKGILRYFPRESRIVDVGARFGAIFRRTRPAFSEAESIAGSGRSLAPHWRRAHWARYWVGPRKADNRDSIIKWIAPTFVNATEEDLPTVVRPVRASDMMR